MRLQAVQTSLDAEEDDGFEDYSHDWRREERDVGVELDRARRRLDGDLKALVERLREVDGERGGDGVGGVGLGAGIVGRRGGGGEEGEGKYEGLRVGGVDRLLMKLDWGGGDDDDEDGRDDQVEDLIR